MLILTRRVGETIVIGADDVRVTVVGVKGNQVKLGVLAPDTISIHREEVYERIIEEQLGQAEGDGHPRSEHGEVPD